MVTASTFRNAEGLALAYKDEGPRDGLPVLCLAGLSRNMRDFEAVAAHLSRTCRVIRLDSRGRGLSERPADPMTYDLPHETGDALALLDHLGIESAVFLGTSRGGLITLAAAGAAPERVRAAIFNDVGPEIDPRGLARIGTYLGRPSAAKTLDELAESLAEDGRADAPTLTRADWRRIAEAVAEQTETGVVFRYDLRLGASIAAQTEALKAKLAEGEPAPDLWPLFETLARNPVLVLRGANSDILSSETAAKMQAVSPQVTLVEIPDRGHVPLLDEPQSLAAIDALIASVSAGPAAQPASGA